VTLTVYRGNLVKRVTLKLSTSL